MKRTVDTAILNHYLDELKRTRVRDPSALQSEEDAEGYRRSLKEGDTAAIRTTYGGFLEFTLRTVTGTKRGRVYTTENQDTCEGRGRGSIDSWFMKSGKNCNAPTGQASLVTPSVEVLDFISKGGHFGWGSWYKDDAELLTLAMFRENRHANGLL